METVKVLNIDIQNITRQELLENLKEGVLVTPNLDHLIKLQKDKEFYNVYRKEDDSCYVGNMMRMVCFMRAKIQLYVETTKDFL